MSFSPSVPVTAVPAAVLELKDVTFRRAAKEILHGVSFTVREGEHWALLGPNGAGKSTIMSFCGAVAFPTSGTVCVLGEEMGHVELAALRRSIGHVNPRHPLRSPLTIRDIVLTGITGTIELPLRWQPGAADLAIADSLIGTLGLAGKADARWRPAPGCCCSTSRPRASTWPRGNSSWKPLTCSTTRTPGSRRSW